MNHTFGMSVGWIFSAAIFGSLFSTEAFGPSSSNRCRTMTTATIANPIAYTRCLTPLSLSAELAESGIANSTLETPSQFELIFPGAEVITVEMIDHIPLGCTVEESLHEDDDFIFITKITEEGNAEKAGLQVGDVIVGVTGLFGDMTSTLNSDVDKIKKLVSAVPEEEPLTIQVARGTEVLERHESSVVELCNTSGASDKQVQECVVDFLAGGYNYENEEPNEELCGNDEDAECLIDGMMNLWADELPPPPTTSGITDQSNQKPAKAPKPWSSRSSPSGTWVRDPKTGKMRNIDA